MSRVPAIAAFAPRALHRYGLAARLADYVQLAKPRIAALELVVVATSAYLAAPYGISVAVIAATLIGTGLVAASASALNQWLEQDADARMVRTASRPLPAGRLGRLEVVLVATAWVVAGTAILWFLTQPVAAAIALASWFVYVAIYTPLKRVAPCNTAVGAVAGALPVLIGWTAVGGQIGVPALAVTTIVFLWQFPHFMAIAWLHRRQYAAVGMQMLPVVDRSGLAAGRVAVAGALALLPICLIPALVPWASNVAVYGFWVIVLGLGQLACAVAFLLRRDDMSARWLLRASLVYLPCVFGLLLLTV